MKRKPVKTRKATYATYDDARKNRREFLRLILRGALAVPFVGLAGCGIGREKKTEEWNTEGVGPVPQEIRPQDEGHWWSDGVIAPPEEEWSLQGMIDAGDPEEEWSLQGKDVSDPEEEWYPDGLPGIDIQETSPQETHEDIEEDFPPLAGVPPEPDTSNEPEITPEEPDVFKEVDTFPPLDGDMEEPAP